MYGPQFYPNRSLNKFKPNSSFQNGLYSRTESLFGKNNSSSSGVQKPLSQLSRSMNFYNNRKPQSGVSTASYFDSEMRIELLSILENERGNISKFKGRIEVEKKKVEEDFTQFRRQVDHVIEDAKLSIEAQLDQLYKVYIEKYAFLKNEIQNLRIHRKQVLNEGQNGYLGTENMKKVGKSELVSEI